MRTMRAAVLGEKGGPLSVQDVHIQDRPAEVLIRIVATGVCHTDLLVIDGDFPQPLPIVLGHEAAGIVEQVGPGVTYVNPGERVIVSCVASCGRCRYCLTGRPSLCIGYSSLSGCLPNGARRLGIPGQEINHFLASAFAEYAVVVEDSLVKIREDAPLGKVCLIGCAVMTGIGAAINTAKVRPGDTCAVLGCGGVGLAVVQGCRLAGASRVIAVDQIVEKLQLAARLGATDVVDASKEDVRTAIRRISQFGVDYAFEAIGRAETIELAYQCLARGGTAVVIGVPKEAAVQIPANFVTERSITGCIYGSARPRVDIPALVDMYMDGRIKLDELITDTYALDGINDAIAALRSGQGVRHVVLP